MAKKTTKKKVTAKKTTAKKRTSTATKKRAPAKKATTRKTTKKAAAKRATKKKATAPKRAVKKKTTRAVSAKKKTKATSRAKSTTKKAVARAAAKPVVAKMPKPRPVKLSKQDLDMFHQMLLQKRAEILGDVSTLHNEALNSNRSEASGDLSSMPIHMADLGTDNYELEFTLGLIEGERAILKEIDEALDRIRKGTYGACLATGKPIGKARLKAKPWAKYCYEYTLAQERGQTPH